MVNLNKLMRALNQQTKQLKAGEISKSKHSANLISQVSLNQTAISSFVVDPPAVLPDLAVGPGERRDVAHLDHGLREVLEEDVLVGGVELDEVGGGGAAGEEDLVGGEQAAVGEDVLVVLVVELEGRDGVEEEEVLVAAGAGAARAQRRCVGRVQCEVREAVARLVVQTLPEARAPGIADGVATCMSSSEEEFLSCTIIVTHSNVVTISPANRSYCYVTIS